MPETQRDRVAKRDKFAAPQKSNGKQKAIVGIVALALVSLFAWSFFGPEKDPNATNGLGGTWYVDKPSYGTSEVQQTEVNNVVEGGRIKLAKQDILQNKIIYTEYKQGNKVIPLTAWINLRGRVVAAISMCEPCKSTRFRVAVDQLVCNTCGTRWKLTSQEGISGAPECFKFPPQEMKYEQDGNYISLDETTIATWVPRV